MEYSVHLDHNRRCLLQYRDTGKVRHYIAISDGVIDCIQLSRKDFLGLKPYVKQTPEHFAEVMLKSTLPISRQSRAILRSILGLTGVPGAEPEGAGSPRFSSAGVTIEEIAQENNWSPSKCRKFLRKCMEKPGGRWIFDPEKAQEVTTMLKEFFANGSAT